ncbi:hypothetical protein [Nocardioides sp.]|uniref:hypothetical protein n=1 Tax=Nocardioides sp. TaxID=35761 RepID=UPI0019B129FF|nr:hypothetical protein [Nocardioides sp.]MBC7274903.1 hypothetical protein [Nocardioides sp.]
MSIDQLLPVVVGAIIALAGSLVVQLLLVPQVENRRRHDERWEQAVLDLGHALVFDESASTLRHALQATYEAVQSPDGTALSREQIADRLTPEQISDLKEALQAFGESLTRFRWLADRVMFRPSTEPRMQDTRIYILKHLGHSLRLVGITQHALAVRMEARAQISLPGYAESFQDVVAPEQVYSVNGVKDAYASLSESRASLVRSLEDMANTEPPRRIGPIRIILHRVDRSLRARRHEQDNT